MYRKIEDFLTDWGYESAMTLKVFKNLTDETFDQSFHNDHRTIHGIAWHILHSAGEMMQRAGLPVAEITEEPKDMKVADLVSFYTRDAEAISEAVKNTWNDEELEDKVPMYGEEWAKGVILGILVRHQAHHRGQLTILMRQAGLRVPGVYGPSKEEWAEYGMPEMA